MRAFDTVSHNILLQKPENAGIGGDFLLWLKDYLANRKQFVSIDEENSEVPLEPYGVPQGAVLGLSSVLNVYWRPLCLSPISRDMPLCRRYHSILHCRVSRCCNYQVKQSPGRAKGMVQQQPPYSTTPGKCRAMLMYRENSIGPVQQLRLGHNNIEWTNSEARLLRVQVDCKLPWTFMSVTRRMHL